LKESTLFRQHVTSHKRHYVLGALLLSISCLLQLIIPYLLELFGDGLQMATLNAGDIIGIAFGVVGVGFAVAFTRSISRIYLFRLSRILERQVRRRLFHHWERLSAEYYGKQRIGDLMSHAINDLNVIREVGMGGVFMSIEAVVIITVTIIAMGSMVSLPLTLLVLLPLPLLTYLGYKFRFQIQTRSTIVQEAIGQLTSRVQQFCSGNRVVKAYVQEKSEMDRFMEDNRSNMEANRKLIHSNSLFTSFSHGIVGLSYLISVVIGGIMVMRGSITLGEFIAFNTYLSFITAPIENLGKVINTFQRGKAADIRLRRVLHTEPEVKDGNEVLNIEKLSGNIEITNLSFTYPNSDKPALQNINLSVPAGGSLAIVGKVGSGKTTLLNLLLRVFNPPRGTIFLDGYELFHIPLRTIRQTIGYVPQEYFLFSTTIKDNIAFDPGNYEPDQVQSAAKLAQVYDNIVEFPKQFETKLGERGISLSGGQRQRISIARALIKNPSILIFDDSLSAVDAETEEKILKGLKRVMKGRTTIIVSHRISTIREADQIIVLDAGKIIEHGDHNTLLAKGGVYANMYHQQLLNRELGG
jgi:ATP-binding cassette subfamily B multidrug efflux pump